MYILPLTAQSAIAKSRTLPPSFVTMPSDNQPKLSRKPKEHNPASVDLAKRIVAIQRKSASYVLSYLQLLGLFYLSCALQQTKGKGARFIFTLYIQSFPHEPSSFTKHLSSEATGFSANDRGGFLSSS
jgi:hypothetical protein